MRTPFDKMSWSDVLFYGIGTGLVAYCFMQVLLLILE